jgi:hypothetical protein
MQEWLQCNNGSNNGVGRGRDLQQLLRRGELDAARAEAKASPARTLARRGARVSSGAVGGCRARAVTHFGIRGQSSINV